jgi:hypothetical protein
MKFGNIGKVVEAVIYVQFILTTFLSTPFLVLRIYELIHA